jgi:tagatose 6-phosphate kinase
MIITHTFNPSVDITYEVENFRVGEIFRPTKTIKNAGGKGVNVTKVLADLNAEVMAFGYLGGTNGIWIENQLTLRGISHQFTKINGDTRQCLAINDSTNQTEVLEKGPYISLQEQQNYLDNLAQSHRDFKVLVVSGSTPDLEQQTNTQHLAKIMKSLTSSTYNIIDVRASELKMYLAHDIPIHCIKPNESEFAQLVEDSNMTEEKMYHHLKHNELLKGIDVFITLGNKGALIKLGSHIYRAQVPEIELQNAVGSGDATVAGIAYGRTLSNLTDESKIQLALACGSANAMQSETGKVSQQDVDRLMKQIKTRVM